MSDRTPGDKAGEGAKRPAVTRSELIRRLADANPVIHRRDIAAAVEVFFAEIAAGLARGGRVELRDFGTFTPKTRRARRARNPSTGAAVEVGTRNYLIFHAGERMRARLNPGAAKRTRRPARPLDHR